MQWLLAPLRFVNRLPQAVAALSLAARIALLVGVFQLVVVLLAIVVLLVGDEQVFEAWWQPGKLAMLAVLLVLTPLLVYQAARLWLERDASPTRWRLPDSSSTVLLRRILPRTRSSAMPQARPASVPSCS